MMVMPEWLRQFNAVDESIPVLLGQLDSAENWTNLLYILLVLIIPALKSFGEWIRARYQNQSGDAAKDAGDPGEPFADMPIPERKATSQAPQRTAPSTFNPPPFAPTARRGPDQASAPPVPIAKPIRPASPRSERKISGPAVPPRPVRRPQPSRPIPESPRVARKVATVPPVPKSEQSWYAPTQSPKKAETGSTWRLGESPSPDATDGVQQVATVPLDLDLTASGLRRIVILSEILRPPLSLRDHPDQFI